LLLGFALCIHVAGHVVSAFATNFELLLIVRALTVLRAAIYAPQAAATAGVVGNWLASRLVAQLGIGPGRRLRHCLLDCGSQSVRSQPGRADRRPGGVGLWGIESSSSNSLQQSRLVVVAPGLAAATVALSTSVVYLGQALGAGLGG
jgi:predicted MFS family arabinose efflux permease